MSETKPRRYTVRGIAMLSLFGLSAPGILFGVIFARFQCFPGRSPVTRTPKNFSMPFESLKMTGPDGVATVGWYMPPPKSPAPAVLAMHGHAGRRDQFLEQAAFLHRAGFGVVLFDQRQHGESGEAVCTFGVREAEECRPYLDFLAARPEHAGQKIGIIGWSMGAVTSLKAASLYPDIAAIVADSPFASLSEQSFYRVEGFVGSKLAPYAWTFTLLTGCLLSGLTPSAWEVTTWLPALGQRPVFFIHGDVDNNIPPDATRRLVAAIGRPVETWYSPGVNHIDTRNKFKVEYEQRVTAFFAKTLK